MKLTRIDEPMQTFSGQGITIPIAPGNTGVPEALTHKMVLLNCLGSARSTNGTDAIRLYALGVRLYEARGEIELDNDELVAIKRAVEQNAPAYILMIQGQVLQWLGKFGDVDRQ